MHTTNKMESWLDCDDNGRRRLMHGLCLETKTAGTSALKQNAKSTKLEWIGWINGFCIAAHLVQPTTNLKHALLFSFFGILRNTFIRIFYAEKFIWLVISMVWLVLMRQLLNHTKRNSREHNSASEKYMGKFTLALRFDYVWHKLPRTQWHNCIHGRFEYADTL